MIYMVKRSRLSRKPTGGVSVRPRRMRVVWQTADGSWKWVAEKYEGNGVFFGKVFSPVVPEGEYGTWYLWEVEKSARLVEGDEKVLDAIKEKTKKAMQVQHALMG